jgi:hypothetical protein
MAAVFPVYTLFLWFFDNWFAGVAFAVAIVYVVEQAHARYASAWHTCAAPPSRDGSYRNTLPAGSPINDEDNEPNRPSTTSSCR